MKKSSENSLIFFFIFPIPMSIHKKNIFSSQFEVGKDIASFFCGKEFIELEYGLIYLAANKVQTRYSIVVCSNWVGTDILRRNNGAKIGLILFGNGTIYEKYIESPPKLGQIGGSLPRHYMSASLTVSVCL